MPHTYMRTSPGTSGLNSCFSPVRELWILSMVPREMAETPPRQVRRHEFEERTELRSVPKARERHPQWHVELGAPAPRAVLEDPREPAEVRGRLIEGGGRGGEELRACRRDDAALALAERRQLAAHHRAPRGGIGRQCDVVPQELHE